MEDDADAAADADPERPGERTVTVKCSLGRLRITPALRIAIENVAARLQILSARGSLIAAEAVMEALLRDAAPPMISSQTWWYNVLTEASRAEVSRTSKSRFQALRWRRSCGYVSHRRLHCHAGQGYEDCGRKFHQGQFPCADLESNTSSDLALGNAESTRAASRR